MHSPEDDQLIAIPMHDPYPSSGLNRANRLPDIWYASVWNSVLFKRGVSGADIRSCTRNVVNAC